MVQHPAPTGEQQIDWHQALRFFKKTLARLIGQADEYLIDSLASDAALRLIRVARREQIKNVEAMMTTIAYRAYQDWKRKVAGAPTTVSIEATDDEEGLQVPDPTSSHSPSDVELASPEWTTFKALELIDQVTGADCREYLKAYYLEEKDHPDIARDLGITALAARKRKSRCEATLARWIDEHRAHPMTKELYQLLKRYEEQP